MILEKMENVEIKDLEMLAKHNIGAAIDKVSSENKCSYKEAADAVRGLADFRISLCDKAVRESGWDGKSGFIPYDPDKHAVFEVGEGENKKKIKMVSEANISYAAAVLRNKNQSTLKEAFGDIKKYAESLSVEHEKVKEKRK